MVGPLRDLDQELIEFSRRYHIQIEHNYHNTPNRMLRWVKGDIWRQIQINLYGDRQVQFSYFAWRDAARERRGKRWPPVNDIPLDAFKAQMQQLLEDARVRLDAVTDAELEYWGGLS